MVELNEQNLVINLVIAKSLLDKLTLCDKDCDCGCVSGVELCDKDCDCGCKDPASEINACSEDCDCGCASGVELCDKDCDCGCKDPASEINACSEDCDCGCASGVELCDKDCNCGCNDNTQGATNNDNQCHCKHCEEHTAFASGGDDGDDKDNEQKKQNETINNKQDNHNEQCHCGCEHHNGHHHHNGQCHHHNDNHSCEGHEHKCDCESEKNLANEYLNLARQIQADFDNYRRRNVDAVKQARGEGVKEAILEFLPALDAVDRAIDFMADEQSREGVMLIKKVFEKAFNDFKVEPIMCLGAHYDPNFHDVVVAEESNQPSGTIIEEIETGYTMDGKVIRHSVVKISK